MRTRDLIYCLDSNYKSAGTCFYGTDIGTYLFNNILRLYSVIRASGIRKAELARGIGIHNHQVERLMDIEHTSRIEHLESAFQVLGLRTVVDVEKAL